MSLTYPQLMDELRRFVESESGGTLFIHSDCDHAIAFTLKSGRITALYFGAQKGREAIPLIRGISGGNCRFDRNGLAMAPQHLPPTPEIIAQLQSSGANAVRTPDAGPEEHSVEPWPEEVRLKFLRELHVLLTDHLGPAADLIFEESMAELDAQSVTEDRLQSLVDMLALNLEPEDITRFHEQIADILNGIARD